MKTYFSRNTKIAMEDAEINSLRERHLIAIHTPFEKKANENDKKKHDSESLDPDHYEGTAKGTLRRFHELAQDGGYVAAAYRGCRSLFVGKVAAGSSVQTYRSLWMAGSSHAGKIAIFRTLKMESVVEVPPDKQLLVLAMAPQRSTFTRWHKIGDKIQRLVDGEEFDVDLSTLGTTHQEVMCSEFLRHHDLPNLPRLDQLMMPVGRSMKGVDIYGLADDGKTILAQVKYDDKPSYRSDLSQYGKSGENHLILFSGVETEHPVVEGNVVVVSLRHTYDAFRSTERGSRWLDAINSRV